MKISGYAPVFWGFLNHIPMNDYKIQYDGTDAKYFGYQQNLYNFIGQRRILRLLGGGTRIVKHRQVRVMISVRVSVCSLLVWTSFTLRSFVVF